MTSTYTREYVEGQGILPPEKRRSECYGFLRGPGFRIPSGLKLRLKKESGSYPASGPLPGSENENLDQETNSGDNQRVPFIPPDVLSHSAEVPLHQWVENRLGLSAVV
jgi:hypothetical protein